MFDSGSNVYTGGGGNDTFFYAQGNGAAAVTDFDQGNTGSFTRAGGRRYHQSVRSRQRQQLLRCSSPRHQRRRQRDPNSNGPDTLINFGNGDTLTLDNVKPSQLVAADFLFQQQQPPPAPTVTWGTATASGTEGQRISLQTISATVNTANSQKNNSLTSIVVSEIPVGDAPFQQFGRP